MSELKLNLGAGEDIREGFQNIDILALDRIDLICDVRKLPYEDNAAEFVVAQHILEYIPRKDMVATLTEWKRVLKEKCPLEIRVTDLALVTKGLYLNTISSEMGLHHEMVLSLLYGRQKDIYDIRHTGFTSEYLQGVLTGIGFLVVNIVQEDYDVIITGLKE